MTLHDALAALPAGVPHPDRLYRADAVAGFLGVTRQTVYCIPTRSLPKVRVGPKGGSVRYLGRDVLSYIERRRDAA